MTFPASAIPAPPADPARRRLLAAGAGSLLLHGLGGCAAGAGQPHPWEARLGGDTIALLGEVHDNTEHHRRRATILRRALDAGWRPALVMEQFDIDRQPDIERSRRDRPRDVQQLIARAAGERSGWAWPHYEPLIALALQLELPLLAGNLPRAQAMRLVREPAEAVLGGPRTRELGLQALPDAPWLAAHEREIGQSHCGALPERLWPGMARAQAARDAVMADVLRQHARNGAVLIAGNGHVRRDIGVPRWLANASAATSGAASDVLSVGFVEDGTELSPGQFDAVVLTAAAQRPDPCADMRQRMPPLR